MSSTEIRRERPTISFRQNKNLSIQDYLVFLLGTVLVFLFTFLFSNLILEQIAVPYLRESALLDEFNIYNLTNTVVNIVFLTELWIVVFFFVLMILISTIIARIQRLQLIRVFLVVTIPVLTVTIAYHLILYWRIQEDPSYFFEESSFSVLLEGLLESIVDVDDATNVDTNYLLFHSYQLLVFQEDPSFENYVYLVLIGKILVPQYAIFTYDYLIIGLVVIAIQQPLILKLVKPCDCFEEIPPGEVEIRRTILELD